MWFDNARLQPQVSGRQTMAEHPFSHPSIQRDLHCTPYRHVVTRFIQVLKASSLRKRLDCQWVPLKYLKYLLNGLRSDVPPQRIWNSHIFFTFFMTVLVKFQIEIRFFIILHGNQNCRWRHVHYHLAGENIQAKLDPKLSLRWKP